MSRRWLCYTYLFVRVAICFPRWHLEGGGEYSVTYLIAAPYIFSHSGDFLHRDSWFLVIASRRILSLISFFPPPPPPHHPPPLSTSPSRNSLLKRLWGFSEFPHRLKIYHKKGSACSPVIFSRSEPYWQFMTLKDSYGDSCRFPPFQQDRKRLLYADTFLSLPRIP